jgi:hypothetical protein
MSKYKTRIINTRNDLDGLKKSTFIITVNTNKAFTSKEAAKKCKQQLLEYFNIVNSNIEDYLLCYSIQQDTYLRINLESSYIKSGDIEMAVEIGTKFSRLHIHSLVRFVHNDDIAIKFDIKKLRSVFPKGTYCNVRFLKDNELDLLKYIRKDM